MEVIHVNSIEEIYALRWNMGKMTFRSLSFLSLEISRSNSTFLKINPSEFFIYSKYRMLKTSFFKQEFWVLVNKKSLFCING